MSVSHQNTRPNQDQVSFFRLAGVVDCASAGRIEYQNDPTKTIKAPDANCIFHPPPNHHTLKHKLIALRAVRTTCVDTADTL